MVAAPAQSPFASFWQAGYECADHLNRSGQRVDLHLTTGHNVLVRQDYAALKQFNIATVREGIRWAWVETAPYQYNWEEVTQRILAGIELGIQQLWEICHFGFPSDLVPAHPCFAVRFAAICRSFVQLYRSLTASPLVLTPINEISFLAYHAGEVRGTTPYATGLGWDLKYFFCKAVIAGIEAAWEVDPSVRILHTEPLTYIHAASQEPLDQLAATSENEYQYQALDIIGGYACPELGGKPPYLDLLGVNYYYSNQWVLAQGRLQWEHPQDERWIALCQLLHQFYRRYQRPIILSETSHLGDGRAEWLLDVAQQCLLALQQGIPLLGICLYPIIDRPDWDNLSQYPNAGLWDLVQGTNGPPQRVLCEPYAQALFHAQSLLGS